MDKGKLVPKNDEGLDSGPNRIDHGKTDSSFDSLGVKAPQFGGDSKEATQLIGDFAANDAYETIDDNTGLISAKLPPDAPEISYAGSGVVSDEHKSNILHVFDDGHLSGDEIRKINDVAKDDPSKLNDLMNKFDKRARGDG